MGEYFKWVNPRKREWIDDEPFDDYGFMLSIASYLGNRYTDAACTLIAGPWRGDPVMYIGDYFTPEEGSPIAGLFDGYPYEDALDNFKNVSGSFRCAEGLLRPVWGDGDDVPYDGPFDTEVHHYRYALNRTRGEYVDRDAGPVRCVCLYDGKYSWDRLDPLLGLLTPRSKPSEWHGRWCLDEVEMTDEPPEGGYKDVMQGACFGWVGPLLFANDAEMAALTASDEFVRECELRGVKVNERDGDTLLRGAIEVLMDVIRPRQVRPLTAYDEVEVPDGRRGRVADMLDMGAAYFVDFEVQDGFGRLVTERFGAGELTRVQEG